ncbi:hypothetical protein [Streptomyces sp. NPDC050164]|uniref:hypothetical protein n=1 Tax=Streptomyces sp. NPDC050164 TaxID=3365605 RepID=UPI0037975A11
MTDEGLYEDDDVVRRSERVARAGWIAIAAMTGVLGCAVAVALLAVALAFGYTVAVMD